MASKFNGVYFSVRFSGGKFYKIEYSSEGPQDDREDTEMTQGHNKYDEQALFMYFIANLYDILKFVFIRIQNL